MKDKIIRNINEQLWREAKARAGFEGITLKQIVEEGLKLRLGYNTRSPANHLKAHLPDKANCADCGREVFKHAKIVHSRGKYKEIGSSCRMMLHHKTPKEQGGTDDPSNLVILCPACHKARHQALKLKSQ